MRGIQAELTPSASAADVRRQGRGPLRADQPTETAPAHSHGSEPFQLKSLCSASATVDRCRGCKPTLTDEILSYTKRDQHLRLSLASYRAVYAGLSRQLLKWRECYQRGTVVYNYPPQFLCKLTLLDRGTTQETGILERFSPCNARRQGQNFTRPCIGSERWHCVLLTGRVQLQKQIGRLVKSNSAQSLSLAHCSWPRLMHKQQTGLVCTVQTASSPSCSH